MDLALEGVRVLDLTQTMAGPFCTMQLADMGADVVKIEPPGRGEMTRTMGLAAASGDDSAAFLALNRNKRSVTLDLKSEPGQAIFRDLALGADVIVENFRPGVTTRLGMDYPTMHALNPRLIYASISGFGQTGPHAERAGYDLIAQGMSGVMSVTGEPGGEPVKSGVPVSDLGAGLYGALGILNAYIARTRSGEGQYVDTSLFEAALSFGIWETAELWATGRVPQPIGSAHRLTAPYQALRTQDGYITVGANNTRLWHRLCETLGCPELVDDARFADNDARMRNRRELQDVLEEVLAGDTTANWVRRFEEAGFPAGPINDYQQVFEDPHTLERKMLEEYEHPVAGRVRTLGIPVKLSETPGTVRLPAPLIGQHNDEVLAEIGVDAARRDALREQGVI
jgi:crotonobetainyl-CoA:carnitine CoA-transferase CaiB-like acyl-CoA transferase